MYTWEMWDKVSPINGCKAKDTGFLNQGEVYIIRNEIQVVLIQSDKYKPYKDLNIQECAQKHCADMNASLIIAEQNYNDTKIGYLNGTITDEQLAEFVVSGKITQAQADEIKQSKAIV